MSIVDRLGSLPRVSKFLTVSADVSERSASVSRDQSSSARAARSCDLKGRREDWDEISSALHAIGVAAQTVEIIGRSAVDDIHGERLSEVLDNVRLAIEDEVDRLKGLLDLNASAHKEVQP